MKPIGALALLYLAGILAVPASSAREPKPQRALDQVVAAGVPRAVLLVQDVIGGGSAS